MKPLEGMLVVAVEQAVAAPLCTARLADAGARVIKIERETGDFARGYDAAACGESSYFSWLNQGKESVCLDFKTAEGSRFLWALLAKADVLVQNLSAGALARAGFSPSALQEANPGLVICNISGYGQHGELADRAAYDLLVQAESGLVSVSGDVGAAGRIGVSVCDIGAGITAYSGVLEALLLRARTGKGDVLSVSLFDMAAEWMTVPYLHAEYGAGAPAPVGLRHPSIAPYGVFTCADQRQVLISVQNEREWQRLCVEVLDSPALATEEHYVSNRLRVENRPALEARISAVVATLDSAEFQRRLKQARIAFGAVNGPADLRGHKAFHPARRTTAEGVDYEAPAHPVRWGERDESPACTEAPPARRTPLVGEHTEVVFEEFCPEL